MKPHTQVHIAKQYDVGITDDRTNSRQISYTKQGILKAKKDIVLIFYYEK